MDTRPRNLPANYCLQQREYKLSNQYAMYENGANGIPVHPAIPTLGYTPSHMNRGVFSHNPVQIESSLFGINANIVVDLFDLNNSYGDTLTSTYFFHSLFSVSLKHFLSGEAASGLYLRGDLGLASLSVTTDSIFSDNETEAEWGWGLLLGVGYAIDFGGSSITISGNYSMRNVEDETVYKNTIESSIWSISAGLLF